MSNLKDIEERQARLREKAEQLAQLTDPQQIIDTAEQMRLEAQELERAAKAFEAKLVGQIKTPKAHFEVVLTDEQRTRVFAETGVHMETVRIDDNTGELNRAMVSTSRDVVERIAIEQARKRKLTEEAERRGKAEMTQLVGELEGQGGSMAELMQELRQDPAFLGGMLNKK